MRKVTDTMPTAPERGVEESPEGVGNSVPRRQKRAFNHASMVTAAGLPNDH
jgi:hypothetical protein